MTEVTKEDVRAAIDATVGDVPQKVLDELEALSSHVWSVYLDLYQPRPSWRAIEGGDGIYSVNCASLEEHGVSKALAHCLTIAINEVEQQKRKIVES